MPALDVPAAPARTIVPPPPEEPPPPAEVLEPPAQQKPARGRSSQAAPPKTEQQPLPAAAPPIAQAPPPPAGTLQVTPPASQAEVIKTIQELLGRARRDLKGVRYGGLNADGKSQYDTATRFIDQAELALKEQNLPYALTLADKAATLGRILAGR